MVQEAAQVLPTIHTPARSERARAVASVSALVALLAIGAAGSRFVWNDATDAARGYKARATSSFNGPGAGSGAPPPSECVEQPASTFSAPAASTSPVVHKAITLRLVARVEADRPAAEDFAAFSDNAARRMFAGDPTLARDGVRVTLLAVCQDDDPPGDDQAPASWQSGEN